MSKEFRFKNIQISPFCQWLNDLHLEPKKSRIRTKFIEILLNHLNNYVQKERTEIIRKYANKDKEGNPIMIIGANGKNLYDIPQEKSVEMNEEYNKLLEGDFVLEINENNNEMFKEIKDIVIEPEYRFGPREGDALNIKELKIRLANSYNEWCTSFDGLELS